MGAIQLMKSGSPNIAELSQSFVRGLVGLMGVYLGIYPTFKIVEIISSLKLVSNRYDRQLTEMNV